MLAPRGHRHHPRLRAERRRQFAISGKLNSRPRPPRSKEDQIFFSYVHSYSVGNLNEFSTYLANFPPAVILPDARTFLPGDTPNRFLAWGTIAFPQQVPPHAESGVPLRLSLVARYNAGAAIRRDSRIRSRFPSSFRSMPASPKTSKSPINTPVRFGVSGSNLTNHFNPISVHANIARSGLRSLLRRIPPALYRRFRRAVLAGTLNAILYELISTFPTATDTCRNVK